ncbi:MAG: EscU/YscU/HrcU family type III secretion system export apparatus switch protein [Candidatus Binatia bacterium]|nr:EscU/YscU/HrcU family type III secretion system export apparatus switch protein [Candidatus Binatia bacterium]
MLEERDQFERTEEPTPRRREEARKKGQVAKSRSLIPAVTLLAATCVLYFIARELLVKLERLFRGCFSLTGRAGTITQEDVFSLLLESGLLFLPVLLPLFAGVVAAGVAGGALQTGFLWTAELLRPDLSRLNPLAGLRRLCSGEAVAELVKALGSVMCLGGLGVVALYMHLPAFAALSTLEVVDIVRYGGREGGWLLTAGVGVMTALAGLDYAYQRWRTEVRLRMSRHEVKEELREHEGDPLIKSRLKSIRQRLARQRMMADAARADVVITNPHRLAVALRYRPDEMAAPKVVAKGAGFVAQRIREIAREKGIPLVENKPLAQLLYRLVEVGEEIPETLYRAVAEVLAYVYRLRQRVDLRSGA